MQSGKRTWIENECCPSLSLFSQCLNSKVIEGIIWSMKALVSRLCKWLWRIQNRAKKASYPIHQYFKVPKTKNWQDEKWTRQIIRPSVYFVISVSNKAQLFNISPGKLNWLYSPETNTTLINISSTLILVVSYFTFALHFSPWECLHQVMQEQMLFHSHYGVGISPLKNSLK